MDYDKKLYLTLTFIKGHKTRREPKITFQRKTRTDDMELYYWVNIKAPVYLYLLLIYPPGVGGVVPAARVIV